jgi:hypothetical protein
MGSNEIHQFYQKGLSAQKTSWFNTIKNRIRSVVLVWNIYDVVNIKWNAKENNLLLWSGVSPTRLILQQWDFHCNTRTLTAMGYAKPIGSHLEHMCTPLKHMPSLSVQLQGTAAEYWWSEHICILSKRKLSLEICTM